MLNVFVVKNAEEMSQKGYEVITGLIAEKPNCVLGMATGGTPEGVYARMRQSCPTTENVTTVNLDEYVGLDIENETSYHYFMKEQLFKHMPFKANYLPNGNAENLQESCASYENILLNNPVDLQLLGIGENGHIGFNEPDTAFDSTTHIVELTESTRNANRRYFEREEDIPTNAITMGIQSIMRAKHVLLLASGEKKADAIKAMLEGPISVDCPASILQRHPNVTVVVDEAAISKCSEVKVREDRQTIATSNLLSNSAKA